MKVTNLKSMLIGAQMGAPIVVTFFKFTTPDKEYHTICAAELIKHFAKAGLIKVDKADETSNTITFRKTPLFSEADANELSTRIADLVQIAEVREIPTVQIVLEPGEQGWQLRFSGGNRFLREIFAATITQAKKYFNFEACVMENKEGVTILDLSAADDTNAYEFSKVVAGIFKCELVF